MPKVVSISGTNRPNNFTSFAVAIVNEELESLGHDVDYIDARELDLGFPGHGSTEDAGQLQDRIKAASGVLLATPEYHGSFSAMTKLIIENLGFPSALAGKPIALVGVAAGRLGAIKSLESLRSVCAHVGAYVLPGAVSVAGVQKAFNKDGVCTNESTERALHGVARTLADYLTNFVCPRYRLEEIIRESSETWTSTV